MPFATLAPYAGICGLLYLILCWRVVRLRIRFKVELGDGGHAELTQAMRVQGNFIEYVPLILLLTLLLAAMGASPYVLHGLGATLVVGRLAHAQGLGSTAGASPGRFMGTVLTWISLLAASVLCLAAAFGAVI